MSSLTILVVDDEAHMRRVLEIMLGRMGYRTLSAADGTEALQQVTEQQVDLIISDLRMPLMNGVQLLTELRQRGQQQPFIVITAHGSIESAVEAMRLGACDYLLRPFDVDALTLAIRRVQATRELQLRNDYLRQQLDQGALDGMIGDSPAMQTLRQQILQVAATRATVLITGDTGTGKEVAARAIHRASDRRDELFVALNCAAIPAEMLESELFGHEKGAFTGAVQARIGKFELASGGTIFLDEITEMPVALQAKLLRVLQEGVVERLGGNQSIQLDLRVIAATNRAPMDAVRAGRLREDLYYRLNVFALELPPLRARREDIPQLAGHLIERHTTRRPPPVLSNAALQQLMAYDYPGNVRELDNLITRALVLSGGGALDSSHFPLSPRPTATAPGAEPPTSEPKELDLDAAVEALERRMITHALTRTGDNKTRAAQLLKISERSIWYKLKKYGLG